MSFACISESIFTEPAKGLVSECRAEVINLAQAGLNVRRDDYKEFMELCLVFLEAGADGVASEGEALDQPRITVFKQPGACIKHDGWQQHKDLTFPRSN